MAHEYPLAEAIAAVSMHVFSELTGEKTKNLIDKLGAPGSNHDLEKVFIESMRLALEKAQEGLKPPQKRQYRDWFGNWDGRLLWALSGANRASLLFLGEEAFNPVTHASASAADQWAALCKTLERWAWEHRKTSQAKPASILEKPESLPAPLSAYLQENLPEHVKQAVPLVLRVKENSAGWIAWQQRFLESTYFEVCRTQEQLARLIRDLANLGGIPSLLGTLRQDILDRFDRQDQQFSARLDDLEKMIALRTLVASVRFERLDDEGPPADPADYLRSLWDQTQSIDLTHFQPPDGTARQFFIERLYTKLTTVIAEEGPARLAAFEKAGRAGDILLHDALKTHRLLVLVGDPGSGKTTFLKRIAFELCHVGLGRNRAATDGRSRPLERLTEYDWDTLPILVDAKHLANHIWSGGVELRGARSDRSDPEWLFHYLQETHRLRSSYFRSQAERGCVLPVDAFDEVADEVHRAKAGELLRKLAAQERYQKTRIVATSRPGEHGGLTRIAGFQPARVAPLGEQEIGAFVQNWCAAVHPIAPEAAAALSKTLKQEIQRPQVRILAKNPMMLTALAVLHFAEKARLPEQRSELYKYILEWLAKVRAARRHDGKGYRDFLAKMRLLAMEMSAGQAEMRAEIKLEEAIDVLEDDFQQYPNEDQRRQAARTFLDAEETHSGMIIKSGSNVRFWHLTFREALTAQALARLERRRMSLLFDGNKLHDRKWRETVLLLAGELMASGGNSDVNEFLRIMLARSEAGAKLRDRAQCVGLIGALLKDLAAWQYSMKNTPLWERYQTMLVQVEDIFDKEKADQIPFDVRLDAANALGQAGDPRLERDNRVRLRGGRFWIGAQKDDRYAPNFDPEASANESPVREVDVAPFCMGRYPVTVAEYRRFLEEERGYEIQDYWRAGGFHEFAQPDAWEDQLDHPNRPVTGVSWYEAAAYCAYAGGRLPREAEWEYAARDGRSSIRYPWGNEKPDEKRANYTYDDSPGAPTPVGLYPAGATPSEIYDLAGNVWEWVEDDYSHEGKVLRGGGWSYFPWFLRVSNRSRDLRTDRIDDFGFRCVWE